MSGKLFVGGLAWAAQEADLEQEFAQFGKIREVKVILDRETGRSRGFAFVTFERPEDAEKALAMDGASIMGRNVRVSVAEERKGGPPRRDDRAPREDAPRRDRDDRGGDRGGEQPGRRYR